jgi:hypothetical protein
MGVVLILVVGFGLFVLLIVWAIKYSKKINARKANFYRDLAQKYELEHTQSKYMMAQLNSCQGAVGGFQLQIWEKMEGSGKNRTVVTRAKIEKTPLDFQFKIGKEHIFSKAGKMLGMKDIEFNDFEFDKKFLLKSKNEEAFRQMLNHKMLNELKTIKDNLSGSIRNDGTSMTYMYYGALAHEKQFSSFEKVVDFMLKLTEQKVF